MAPEILKALFLTTIAGLSTTIGSLIGLVFKKESSKFMSFVLGFTAGVMIGVSFFELLPSGFEEIGFVKASIAVIAGFIFIFIIDYFVPHEYIGQKERITDKTDKKLLRTGLFIALGIGLPDSSQKQIPFVFPLSLLVLLIYCSLGWLINKPFIDILLYEQILMI